ncbi:hypothetical protein L7G72_10185 [Xenorhabdus bovienii]|uniref:Uncharacterized protein n=1 Tax=Xenorhabdus bovienii TaxID=40576 RepID=A0A0B6XGD3_XENBV|nr:hypothetical protein [Xenorhabdus bovienii]MCG3462215.1 hypothetical protein [Xenorhabdus bovienii]CDM92183.1 conserved protein of unknown function [Xenorhabdus bovienii]
MTIEYAVIGKNNSDDLTDRYALKNDTLNASSLKRLAEMCAKDYNDNHDGWGAYWPIDIVVFSEGRSVGVFRVEQEYNPTFTASCQKG